MAALNNIRHETFIQLLVADPDISQRKAYRKAYDNYESADTYIDEQASRVFNRPEVKARYEELTNKIASRLEEDGIVSIEEVVKELKKIGFADIKDFLEFKTDLSVVGYEDGEPVNDYRTVVQLKESSEVDGTLINEISISKDGTLKFKLHDKLSALEKIGKHLKMFTDKVETIGEQSINIQFNVPRPNKDT